MNKETVEQLCTKYDIAVYKVGDTFFKDDTFPKDYEKWFISTLDGEGRFKVELDYEVPLSKSEDEAKQLAVKIYKLDEIEHKKLKP